MKITRANESKSKPKLKAFSQKVRSLDIGPREFSHQFRKKEGSVLSIAHREIIPLSKVDTIKHAADKMAVNRVRRLYIIDAKKNLEGMVSATDIVNFLGGGDLHKIVAANNRGRKRNRGCNRAGFCPIARKILLKQESFGLYDAKCHNRNSRNGS